MVRMQGHRKRQRLLSDRHPQRQQEADGNREERMWRTRPQEHEVRPLGGALPRKALPVVRILCCSILYNLVRTLSGPQPMDEAVNATNAQIIRTRVFIVPFIFASSVQKPK